LRVKARRADKDLTIRKRRAGTLKELREGVIDEGHW
jgi:hypothetical protein